jgi:hypothetical protein
MWSQPLLPGSELRRSLRPELRRSLRRRLRSVRPELRCPLRPELRRSLRRLRRLRQLIRDFLSTVASFDSGGEEAYHSRCQCVHRT